MRSLAVFTFVIAMSVGGLSAQQAAEAPAAKPPAATPATTKAKPTTSAAKPATKPAAKPAPKAETPKAGEPEKKKGFFKRLFSRKDKEEPAPAPAPAPKPKPKQTARPATDVTAPVSAATTKPAPEKKPDEIPVSTPVSSEPQTESKPSDEPPQVDTAAPAADDKKSEPPAPAAEAKKGAKNTKGKKEPAAKTVTITDNMDEVARQAAFKTLKAQALEDEEIKSLKEKADTAVSESASREAAIAYNRALFRKIRQLEPKLNDYTERIEASMMKMLKAD